MRVFVTGASGFIGSAVVAELLDAGHKVTGLARSGASADRLTALGADIELAALSDTASLQAAAAASDGVIHLAYRHGELPGAAAETDRQVIQALGDALAGSSKPLVVTSGTLVPPGLACPHGRFPPARPRCIPLARLPRRRRWPASSAATRSLLAWEPTHPSLLDEVTHGEFFQGAQ